VENRIPRIEEVGCYFAPRGRSVKAIDTDTVSTKIDVIVECKSTKELELWTWENDVWTKEE